MLPVGRARVMAFYVKIAAGVLLALFVVALYVRHRGRIARLPELIAKLECPECGDTFVHWSGEFTSRYYRLKRPWGAPAIVAIPLLACSQCSCSFDYLYTADGSLSLLWSSAGP